MAHYTTIKEIEQELQKGYALARLRAGDDQSLERMRGLLNVVGNPHEKLKVVHIAGTSGKTSTSYYIAALLSAGGAQRVGLTVSPHVRSFAERLQVNGQPIPERELTAHFSAFQDELGPLATPPGTYFEVLITFVYWVFERIGVDYAVMETGLGGLHDCTNVAARADKVCVITDIGYDHTEILGETIEKITNQKAGIIHDHNAVFMISQSPTVNGIVAGCAQQNEAFLHVIGQSRLADESNKLAATTPAFQKRNWVLARTAYSYIAERDGLSQSPDLQPSDVVVPGRMEIHRLPDGSQLVLDSAHNAQKIAAFVASFSELFPGKKASVLLALKSDKDYEAVTKALAEITDELIVTQFQVAQDVPLQSLSAEIIARAASPYVEKIHIVPELSAAYQILISSTSEVKLVIGSIYLLGSLYELKGGNL